MSDEELQLQAQAAAAARLALSGATPQADLADKIAGSPLGRYVIGAAEPILGVTARAANALGDPSGVETLSHLKQMQARGRESTGNKGFDWAGLAGNVMSPVTMAATTVAPAASVAGRIGQGAGIGTLLGGTTMPEGDSNWLSWLASMGLGGAVGTAASSPTAVPPFFKSLFGSTKGKAGRLMADVAGERAPAVASAMQSAETRVPGETLNAGQAAVSAESPEFSALQQMVASRDPKKYGFGGLEGVNEDARQAAVAAHAGSPDKIAAAVRARSAAADPLYAAVQDSTAHVRSSPVLDLVRDFLEKNKNENAITKPLSEIEGKLTIPTDTGMKLEDSPRALVSLSKDIQTKIKAKNPDGTPEYDISVLTKIKDKLDEQIGKAEPAFAKAQATFKEMSIPIDNMKTGQRLEKALTDPLGVSERPAAFARAAADTRDPIKNAQTQAAVDAVTESLSRNALHDKLAREGASATTRIIGAEPPKVPSIGMFSPKFSMGRAILNYFSGKGTDRLMNYLSENMDDPKAMAALLKEAISPQQSALVEALIRARNPAIAAATYSGGH